MNPLLLLRNNADIIRETESVIKKSSEYLRLSKLAQSLLNREIDDKRKSELRNIKNLMSTLCSDVKNTKESFKQQINTIEKCHKMALFLLLSNFPNLDPWEKEIKYYDHFLSQCVAKRLPNNHTVINKRTVAMRKYLRGVSNFNAANQTIKVAGQTYTLVSGEVTDFNQHLASVGSSPFREVILLDPHSKLLKEKFVKFNAYIESKRKNLGRQVTPRELAIYTNQFIRTRIFPSSLTNYNLKHMLNGLVSQMRNDPNVPKISSNPCIPIDVFITTNIGVCRHHTLITTYLLSRLAKEHSEHCSAPVQVQAMRDIIGGGAHQWVTLVSEKDGKKTCYCLDTLNDLVGDIADQRFQNEVAYFLGRKALRHQQQRAEEYLP